MQTLIEAGAEPSAQQRFEVVVDQSAAAVDADEAFVDFLLATVMKRRCRKEAGQGCGAPIESQEETGVGPVVTWNQPLTTTQT
jgi:hypothetical protein